MRSFDNIFPSTSSVSYVSPKGNEIEENFDESDSIEFEVRDVDENGNNSREKKLSV